MYMPFEGQLLGAQYSQDCFRRDWALMAKLEIDVTFFPLHLPSCSRQD